MAASGTVSAASPTARDDASATVSGARSGALLAAASVVSIGANYVFLLASGRILGSDGYGSLAALLGLLAVVLLPAGALQMAVSRDVSRLAAAGEREQADAFAWSTLRLAALATAPLVVLALALAWPLSAVLHIDSIGIVALTQSTLVTALVTPVAIGILQGLQRFHALAGLLVLPLAIRLALLPIVAAAGYRLGGVVVVNVVGAVGGTLAALFLIRGPLRRGASAARPDVRPFLRYLGLVAAGLVGIALLTHVDVLVVKARFSGDEAGGYGAASAFARVAFFLPTTILSVLFPRTAARQARGEDTADILGRSLIATAGFCALLAVFYAAAGEGLVVTSFGADFASGGRILAPFALAVGLFSLANVLVGYHLSRGERRYAWIVAAGVVVQVVLLAVVPHSLRGVAWTNVGVGVLLVAAHEVFVGSSFPAVRAGLRHFAEAADVRFRRLAAEGVAVVLASAAFVCALFWQATVHFDTTVVGRGSDAAGGVGSLWQREQEGGFHLFGTTHHTYTGAPFGWDQGNGLNVQQLLPYYPAHLATELFDAVAALNLVLFSGYVLSAAAMYLLARYLGCARLVAVWAGVVYVVFPWHLARTPHPSLTHLEFLPILLVALIAAARRPTAARFLLVGLVTMACWLTSGYFGAMAMVTAGAFAVFAALGSTWRRGAALVGGATGAALAGGLFVAFLGAVAGLDRSAGLQRVAPDLTVYGVRLRELLLPSQGNLVFGDWVHDYLHAHQHGSNPTETSNYLGLLTIALALFWLVVAWRRRSRLDAQLRAATLGLTGVFVAALLLALPSPISILGHDVWMPSRLLFQVVPAIRVPTRWIALVMTALVPLAALGLQVVWTRLARSGARVAAIAVAAAVVVSFLELTISPASPRIRTDRPPAEYTAIARTPPGIVAEYPLVENIDYYLWQTVYRRPMLLGAPPGTAAADARRVLLDPAVPGTAEQLRLLGVTAIVTHPNALSFTDDVPEAPDASWGRGYSLVSRAPDGTSVWSVVARPSPALVTLPTGFGDPEPPKNGVVAYPLTSPSGVAYFELRAKQEAVVRLLFDAVPPAGGARVLRVADAHDEKPITLNGPTHVSLLVRVPRGHSRLLLKTDPPPTSAADAIRISAARTGAAAGAAELAAEQISSDPGF